MQSSFPKIFLSYSRRDQVFATALRDKLIAAGHSVWHDIKDMHAGQWWSQIAETLDSKSSVEHIVLIVSPEALSSRIVEREWKLAQREGKTLSPVIPPAYKGKIDFNELPGWIRAQHFYDLSETDQTRILIEDLQKQGKQPRRPDPLMRLPEKHVFREELLVKAKSNLISENKTSNRVILRGPGGFGKSTLAIGIVNDEEIRDYFFDGILWIELGEDLLRSGQRSNGLEVVRASINSKMQALIQDLTGIKEDFSDLDRTKSKLLDLLEYKHVLVVIDDVWAEEHVQHFLDAAPKATKLITTRRMDILPTDSSISVDQMTESEALSFVRLGLPTPSELELELLQDLSCKTAGCWPILIKQINAQLVYQTAPQAGRQAVSIASAAGIITNRLRLGGIDDLDQKDDTQRSRAIRLTIGVSLELLAQEDAWRGLSPGFHESRFFELAGFFGTEIPTKTIARLWKRRFAPVASLITKDTAPLSSDKFEWHSDPIVNACIQVLETLYSLALVKVIDHHDDDGYIILHDVIRRYLIEKWDEKNRIDFHKDVSNMFSDFRNGTFEKGQPRDRRYYLAWVASHLHAAGDYVAVDKLFLDTDWIQGRIRELADIPSLIGDYHKYSTGSKQKHLADVLRAAGPISTSYPEQFWPQVAARLRLEKFPELLTFVERAKDLAPRPCLMPQCATFRSQGREGMRINAHALGPLRPKVSRISGDRIASLGWRRINSFGALRQEVVVLDPNSGRELRRFLPPEGTEDLAGCIGGKIATLHEDAVIIWNSDSGEPLQILEATPRLTGWIASFSDGKIVAGGRGSIEIGFPDRWDERRVFSADANHGAVLSNETIITSKGKNIVARDVNDGNIVRSFEGMENDVYALDVSSSGIIVAVDLCSLYIWRAESEKLLHRLGGFRYGVSAVSVLRDKRALVGCDDGSIHVWDIEKAKRIQIMPGRNAMINDILPLNEGMVVTASSDGCLTISRLENSDREVNNYVNYRGICGLAAISESHVITVDRCEYYFVTSWRKKIRRKIKTWSKRNSISSLFWNTLVHTNKTLSLRSGIYYSPNDIFSIVTRNPTEVNLYGNKEHVSYKLDSSVASMCVLPDLSTVTVEGCIPFYLTRWSKSGQKEKEFGHQEKVINCVASLPDGIVITASEDKVIRAWNPHTEKQICNLNMDEEVWVMAVTPSGTIFAGDMRGQLHEIQLIL
jgi:WD40 repeat protein